MSWFKNIFGASASPQTIYQILEDERAAYLDALKKLYDKERPLHEIMASEPLIELSTQDIAAVYRKMRLDLLIKDGNNGSSGVSNLGNPATFKPVTENWDGLQVSLHPFVWNGVDFEIDGNLLVSTEFCLTL
jgi:hypothetical protein